MFRNILLLLFIGAFTVIFITRPLYQIATKVDKVSIELNELNYNLERLIDFERKPYEVEVGSLSIQQSLGGLQEGFTNMSKSLEETNEEFKSLNKKIGKSRLLKF